MPLDPNTFWFTRFTQPDFILAVSMGLVPGMSLISKFGDNPAIATGVTGGDIWDYPGAATYTFSTTAIIDSISSDNNGDTVDILIQGLDENYETVNQVVTLTGQTRKALSTPLIRVFRAFNNNGTDLLGNVYIYENTILSGGAPVDTTKTRAYISSAEQQTLMLIYTIPAKTVGFYHGITASLSKERTTVARLTGSVRTFGKVFRTQVRFDLSSAGSSQVLIPPTSFPPFSGKSDIKINAEVSAADTGVTATLDLLIVDEDKLPLDFLQSIGQPGY